MRWSFVFILVAIVGRISGEPSEIRDTSLADVIPVATDLETYRLVDDVLPLHYDIELTPYFEDEDAQRAFTFDGIAVIKLKPNKTGVDKIMLHESKMQIQSIFLKRADDSFEVPIGALAYNEATEILTIPTNQPLSIDVEYFLIFNYVGVLGDDMHGFYRSYFNVNNQKVWMASTQFQQTAARRAFPCFDEPKFKATFQVTINRLEKHKSFSNTPIRTSTSSGDGRVKDVFEKTPEMSTYLLAFIVADYIVNERSNMGILARSEARNQTDYSLQIGIDVLAALDEWIAYPYSEVPEMTRMYMAAVPDFSAGAMENWGLLTYRETNILFSRDDATSLQQQRIAAVIAHEIAHQWFGDLVTCEWWDVTWLNEGFARYFQYFGTALVETKWDLEYQFVVEQLQAVMQMDSLESTHPMTHSVYTQAQISGIFDNISYNKGAVTLRMVEHILTTDVFKLALREYIREREYKTSRPEHLFAALNEHGHSSIRLFIEPWTVQSGYPLVTVNQTDGGFVITQKRFLLNNMSASEDNTLWPLLLTYATKQEDFRNTTPIIVMDRTHRISIDEPEKLAYFILNNQQVGYYRVNYDTESWAKISKALNSENFGGIHVLNRAQIVDDLFNLARADVVSYDFALDILDYLRSETEYPPWLAAVNGLTTLSRRIHLEDEELFGKYILLLFNKIYNSVKFVQPAEDEARLLTYLRINALQWACNYGHDTCKKVAEDTFRKFFTNRTEKVHPDLRQIVYCEGIRQGTDEHFDFLWNEYLTTNVATEQILVLQGLGCAQGREQIFKLMDAISSDDIRPQDKSSAFSYLLSNPYTLDHLSEYLRTYYVRWAEAHGSYMNVASAFSNILARVKSDEQVSTIVSFAARNEKVFGEAAYNAILRGVEDYDTNKLFTEENREEIKKFLQRKTSSSASKITTSIAIVVGFLLAMLRWDS
ncbi:membrane alanyl aminopeptidase-like [Toxorhynchites rutilus septentrionalis]|uniref:membrane alanyl aminopeptidase-like n=1 Tax=Toxorhynchites rutilus septentrionalis TaxID=329112 RepID=UPI002479CADE|nr:membrane alanyl aminopeptidase-like [Toxorhynchites rutilus septentrionalis]